MRRFLVNRSSVLSKKNIVYLCVSVVVNLLIALLAIFVFGVHFVCDDDTSMSYIAYGIYMEPSARIVFSNVVYGWLIKSLFTIRETINWQVALYFVALCAGGFISLYEVLKTQRKKLLLLWTLFVVVFFHCSYVGITYTVIAGYVCCLGYLAFFLSIEEKNIICEVLSGLAILYASLIRVESVLAISMCVFLSWIVIVGSNVIKNEKIDWSVLLKKYVFPFVILVGALGVFYIGDKIAYQSDEWASYYKYYLLRGEILDDCSIINEQDYDEQEKLGISKETADTLNNWYFNDPDVFTEELFAKIDKESTKLRTKYVTNPFFDTVVSVKRILSNGFEFEVGLITLGVLVLMMFIYKKSSLIKLTGLILSVVPFFVQIFAYCYMGRYSDVIEKVFPQRMIDITTMGFWVCFILIEACCKVDDESVREEKGLEIISLGILLCFSFFVQGKSSYNLNGFSLKSESMIEEEYSYLNDGHIYVYEFQALQKFMNEYRVWQNPPQGYLNNCVSLGGCEINYPLLVKKQNELGVRNPYRALFENDNVYLWTCGEPIIELAYLRNMYDENIEYELISTHGDLSVYNFHIKK